jgi:hypothetical protein
MPKPPLEPSRYLNTREAYRLLGVSRARFDQWRTAGLISPAWHNGARPMYLRTDVLALPYLLPRRSKPVAPLLPTEDQALARERAGEPDFVGLFAEHFQRLVPSLGENEARRRALANTIRVYRVHHGCAYKPASAAVRALIPPKSQAAEQPPLEPQTAASQVLQDADFEPETCDQSAEGEQPPAAFSEPASAWRGKI